MSLRHLSFLIPVIVGICRHAYLKTYMYLYFSADLGMGSRSVYIGIRSVYGCHMGGIWAVYDGIRMVSGCINAGGNRWYRVVYGWYAGGIRVVYGWFTELDTKYEPETLVALERHQAVMDR